MGTTRGRSIKTTTITPSFTSKKWHEPILYVHYPPGIQSAGKGNFKLLTQFAGVVSLAQ